jgi:hypothetical protein
MTLHQHGQARLYIWAHSTNVHVLTPVLKLIYKHHGTKMTLRAHTVPYMYHALHLELLHCDIFVQLPSSLCHCSFTC